MGCLCLDTAVFICLRCAILGKLVHFLGITVVSCDDRHTADRIDCRENSLQSDIYRLDADNCGFKNTCMSDHIAVREVNAHERILVLGDELDELVCDLRRLHPRALLERNDVRRDLDVLFEFVVELRGSVTVEEVCNMAVLLCLGDRQLSDALVSQKLTECISDDRRRNEELLRDVKVAVVLEHTGVIYVRNTNTVELVKISTAFKCNCQLLGTVATEVVKDNTVAVFDRADRSAVFSDNECREILVDNVRDLGTECLDGFFCSCELSALTENVSLPACFDHTPVCAVTVHGDDHTSAAAGDPVIVCCVGKLGKLRLELVNILQRRCFTDITSVQENVDTYFFYALFLSFVEHSEKMVDMRVNVTIGKKSDEVHRAALLCVSNERLPYFALIHALACERLGNQFSALAVYLAGSDCIVAYLGVTHVTVRRKTYCRTVCLKFLHRIILHAVVQDRLFCACDSITCLDFFDSHAIHNDQDDRAFVRCTHTHSPFL